MLTTIGSPLVAGAAPKTTMADKFVQVRVLRAFLLKQERQEPQKILQLEARLAAELAGFNKVELLKEPPAKAVPAKPAAAKE